MNLPSKRVIIILLLIVVAWIVMIVVNYISSKFQEYKYHTISERIMLRRGNLMPNDAVAIIRDADLRSLTDDELRTVAIQYLNVIRNYGPIYKPNTTELQQFNFTTDTLKIKYIASREELLNYINKFKGVLPWVFDPPTRWYK